MASTGVGFSGVDPIGMRRLSINTFGVAAFVGGLVGAHGPAPCDRRPDVQKCSPWCMIRDVRSAAGVGPPSAVFETWRGEQRQHILTVGASEWVGHDKEGEKSPV
jgi:hypothetical protein